jgi:hypothetical protein
MMNNKSAAAALEPAGAEIDFEKNKGLTSSRNASSEKGLLINKEKHSMSSIVDLINRNKEDSDSKFKRLEEQNRENFKRLEEQNRENFNRLFGLLQQRVSAVPIDQQSNPSISSLCVTEYPGSSIAVVSVPVPTFSFPQLIFESERQRVKVLKLLLFGDLDDEQCAPLDSLIQRRLHDKLCHENIVCHGACNSTKDRGPAEQEPVGQEPVLYQWERDPVGQEPVLYQWEDEDQILFCFSISRILLRRGGVLQDHR